MASFPVSMEWKVKTVKWINKSKIKFWLMRAHIALEDFCSWRLSHDCSTPLSQPCSLQGCSQSSREDTLHAAASRELGLSHLQWQRWWHATDTESAALDPAGRTPWDKQFDWIPALLLHCCVYPKSERPRCKSLSCCYRFFWFLMLQLFV